MPVDIDLLSAPIEPTDPDFVPLLAHLQGNILKSHGRNHTVDLFLTFKPDYQGAVRRWLGDFSRRYVTSALRQLHESAEFKANGLSGRIFATVSLSAEGYRYLKYDTNAFVERRDPSLTTGVTFAAGMKAAAELKDPAPTGWEFGADDIHVLVLLADEDPIRLRQVLDRVKTDLDAQGILDHHFEQEGVGIRDESNQPLEHFGYRDGVSQPLFYRKDVSEERERFGTSEWDPSAPLRLALVPDPFAPAPESFGSYLVYRKLEQDVLKFKTLEKELVAELGLQGVEEERAGALVIGRFENGVPVERSGSEQAIQFRDFNDFNYHDDLQAARCPFQAHIRKTNPRGDTARVRIPGLTDPDAIAQTDAGEQGRRITRRGITYGDRETNAMGQLIRPGLTDTGELNPAIEGEVGLLFQCYQGSIPDQFGFMQKAWVNAVDFASATPPDFTGIDPIIGQTTAGDVNAQAEDFADGSPATPLLHQWPLRYDDATAKVPFNFGDVVRLRGGEFFFTPSVSFLTSFGKANRSVQEDVAEQERRIVPNRTAE
ncbi:MAG: peroxidase [Akkermansiaceae bacterium]|nr:peroxidase [Armatimonadota bacterium]